MSTDVSLEIAEAVESQLRELTRGVVELHVAAELKDRLAKSLSTGRPLRVKAGFDPTAPDLHLGHTVLLTKMAQFQRLGHTAIFLVGDYTAMIGDPTGKSVTRPPLSREQVLANTETYKAQVWKLLDPAKTEVRFNSEWLSKLNFADILQLASRYSASRIFERRDFKERIAAGGEVAMNETLYPLMQGYDSVALECDVELGGTDQLFNLLVGRDLQRRYGQPPQIVMTTPLLEGTDGVEKMSKSLGNYIGIAQPADEQFGKLMSIPDGLMWKYYELLSFRSAPEIDALKAGHPMEAKKALGVELVSRYHGAEAGAAARAKFESTFSRGEWPADAAKAELVLEGAALFLIDALVAPGIALAKSKGEARRLIEGGGVRVDGVKIADVKHALGRGTFRVQAGKRGFAEVTVK